jgi:hypothetical protein
VKVKMVGKITGGRFVDNGDGTSTHIEYPGPGEIADLPDDFAAQLLAGGMAKPLEAGELESAAVDTKPARR